MKTPFKLLAVTLLLSSGAAHAIAVSNVVVGPGLFTTQAGVCTVTFNTPETLTSCANATYSGNAAGHIVSGDLQAQYAQPQGDATPYLTVGGNLGDPVTITFTTGANYFGFYAGSIDSYNGLTFTAQGGSSVTLSGDQINAFLGAGNANSSQAGYFNIFTDSLFTSISLSSSSAAFETDNHAFGIASPVGVPEPGSIALLGLGALALVAGRRRASK